MSQLQEAIQELTYRSNTFPKKAFEIISANREEALPYLRGAIEKVLEERDELEEEYQLHFYALYFLGEFQDKEFFPKLMELVSLPGDELDALIGDTITEGLSDILYNTFNGDMELLKAAIRNEQADEYVRSGLLDVMGQLYLDGQLEEEEWKEFLRKNIHSGEEYSYFYNGLASEICQCHFVDMLPEIRYMLDNELMDEMTLGKYDSCVDSMFEYHDWEKNFCISPMKAADMLKDWAMFTEDVEDSEEEYFEKNEKELEKRIKQINRSMEPLPARKIGRNDPCPCGSGKKYKFCCLNKPKTGLDAIESPEERQRWLARYPQVGGEHVSGKVYLEDYFDLESIEIDKLLYLGLMQRPGLRWMRDEEAEEKRCCAYLSLAFELFVKKVEKEGVTSFEDYNRNYSIHYYCEDWLGELLSLLHESGNKALLEEVEKWCKLLQKSRRENGYGK